MRTYPYMGHSVIVTAFIVTIVGGLGSLEGANEIVLRELGVDQARPLIYGAILIASILFLPDGLESLGPKVRRALARDRAGEGASG